VLVGPTSAQRAYFAELQSEYREEMGAVNQFFGEKATALGRLLEENGAPGILLPAPIPPTN
jgi:hypothetical protein